MYAEELKKRATVNRDVMRDTSVAISWLKVKIVEHTGDMSSPASKHVT